MTDGHRSVGLIGPATAEPSSAYRLVVAVCHTIGRGLFGFRPRDTARDRPTVLIWAGLQRTAEAVAGAHARAEPSPGTRKRWTWLATAWH